MILHTVIDYYDIIGSVSHSGLNNSCCYKNISGGILEYRRCRSGGYKVSRLHSTNPSLYLDKKYYPF